MSARRASAAAACAAAAALALPRVAAASPAAAEASQPHLAPPPAGADTQLAAPLEGLVLKQAHVIFRCEAARGAGARSSLREHAAAAAWL